MAGMACNTFTCSSKHDMEIRLSSDVAQVAECTANLLKCGWSPKWDHTSLACRRC